MATRVRFADYVERKKAAGAIIIELDEGVEVTVPPAELWPDGVFDANLAGDADRASRLVLGDDQYAVFVAAGGNWRILNGIIAEQQGVGVGESGASPES